MDKIAFPLKSDMEGAAVANLQAALQALLERELLLGKLPGLRKELASAFKKEREARRYLKATERLVQAYQAERKLKQTGMVDEETAHVMTQELRKLKLLDDPEPAAQVQSFGGRLAFEYGEPAAGLRLRFYQRRIGQSPVLLQEIVSDGQGHYEFEVRKNSTAMFELCAVGPDGEEVRLSRTLIEVPQGDAFDLVVPAALRPPVDEFSRLKAALGPHTDGHADKIKDAVERGGRFEFSLLAQATGWDAGALALAADAFEVEAHTGLPAAGVYALARAGLPHAPDQLIDLPAPTVERALRQAAEAGIVSEAQMEESLQRLGAFVAEQRYERKVPGTLSSAKDFALKARISTEDRQAFERVLMAESSDKLWERAKAAGVSKSGIEALQLQGKLAYLTFNNAELVDFLSGQTGSDPKALIGLGYYDAAQWEQALHKLAGNDEQRLAEFIPSAYAGTSVKDRLGKYTSELARRVRQMDPHAVTVERVVSGRLGGLSQAEGVARFLRNAVPLGFRLGQTPLGGFVQGKPDAVWAGIAEDKRATVLDSVRRLYSLYASSPDDATLEALLRAGYSTASAIAGSDYEVFRARLLKFLPVSTLEGDLDVTRVVYNKAHQQAATVFNVFDGYKRLGMSAAPPGATPQESAQRADQIEVARKRLAGKFPTLETLFGSVDYCHCDHCQSVLSPAAYLVDLLRFVDPDDEAWATVRAAYEMNAGAPYPHGKPFVALDARRPDLKNIALTCENTHTALPYIDIVNEVLEQVMMSGVGIDIQAYDVGEASSADLIAEPQNILWSAYVGTGGRSLREQVYPVSLPFDLPLEMARAFLRQLDLPLWRLRSSLARPTRLEPTTGRTDGWTDVWFERLGLGAVDVAVLTRASDWHRLFGYGSAAQALETVTVNGVTQPAEGSLRNARTLARRLEISYVELAELLRTRFINPEIEHLIALKRLDIDPDALDRYLEPGTPRMDAAEVAEFEARLVRLGVQKQELAALRTDAVRQVSLVLRSGAVCDFSRTTLAFAKEPGNPNGAYALVLHKMNAMVRLQKKLGWDIHELDRLLMALMPGAASVSLGSWPAAMKTALVYLAHVEELRECFQDRLKREEIALFWTDIPATGVDCLYERLFLRSGLPGMGDALDKRLGRVLQDGNQTLEQHADLICQAMQLAHVDMAPILSAAAVPDRRLSLANLSVLMRHVLLARGLNMKVDELLGHMNLSGVRPLSPLSIGPLADLGADVPWAQTRAFVRELDLAREAQADLAFLERMCWHRGVEEVPDAQSDPALLALLALPPEQAGQEEVRQALVVKTVAAQLSLAVPTVDFLLGTVLKDGNNQPLKKTGFVDSATAQTSLKRLRRAADLVRTLEVTTEEIRYLCQLAGALDPARLPTAPVTDPAAAKTLRQGLRLWFEMAALRRCFGRSERVLAVLAAAQRQPMTATNTEEVLKQRLHDAMSALTGLKLPGLAVSLDALGARSTTGSHFEVALLADTDSLTKTLEALTVLQRIGLNPVQVLGFATTPVDDSVARQLRSSLKARYRKSAWRQLVQPIFDGLRAKQRNALVAHLTHVTDAQGRLRYGDTQEKLFEFLLLDPGMEPVVLASRIQLAISSVQLFVQRCLMNLEDHVSPQIIDARRWEWMRRYRVWEVNRKMFIWPENWLDPEFRDDKTHLFRELESKLLQGDVTEDLVRKALHTYLKGLEEIGRLCLLTMYFEPGASADGAALHVVGRSMNAPHKYYYRKVTHGMWTPWEPVDTGIEGEHLVLTSWRGRMHLFWLSFLEQSKAGGNVPEQFNPATDKVMTADIQASTQVDLQLHWVEHVGGRWVNRSSTPDFAPTEFENEKASTDEQKRAFHVRAVLNERAPGMQDDELEIHVSTGAKKHRFVFFSKLAAPRSEKGSGTLPPTPPYDLAAVSGSRFSATKWRGHGALRVNFTSRVSQHSDTGTMVSDDGMHTILQGGAGFSLLFPGNETLPVPAQQAPAGVGRPAGFAYSRKGLRLLTYRSSGGDIVCLSSAAQSWTLHAPSAEARRFDPAPMLQPAVADPHGYALEETGDVCLVYAGHSRLLELVLSTPSTNSRGSPELRGVWRVETLYESSNRNDLPRGRPLGGIFEPSRGAVFRTAAGQLRAAVRTANDQGWHVRDLLTSGVKAAGDPCGFVTRDPGAQGQVRSRHVFYLGTDGHIHQLSSNAAGQNWQHVNITAGLAGYVAPAPDGALAAYPFLAQRSVHVVYRDDKGRVHELQRKLNGPWSHERITAQEKKAVGDPMGYATEYASTRHVVFRAEGDEVVELWWNQGKWREIALAQKVQQATSAFSDIAGLALEKAKTQYLLYLGDDGRPRELWEANGWRTGDCLLESPFPDALGALAAPFFYESAARDHTFFVEPYVMETAVHEWTDWIVTTREFVPAVQGAVQLRPLASKAGLKGMRRNPLDLHQLMENYRSDADGPLPRVKTRRGPDLS